MTTSTDPLLTRDEVLRLLKVSRSSLYLLIAKGGFPQPVKLGPLSNRWVEREVQEWLRTRPRAMIKGGWRNPARPASGEGGAA